MLKGKFERDLLPRGGEETATSRHSALKGEVDAREKNKYTINVSRRLGVNVYQWGAVVQ